MTPVYKHNLFLVFTLFMLFSGTLFAQLPTVDIGIFQNNVNQIEVRVRPNFPVAPAPQTFDGLFSNLQFTIVTDVFKDISLGQPIFQVPNNFYMYPLQAGTVTESGGKRYQKYAGFGFSTIGASNAPVWVPGGEYVIAVIQVTSGSNSSDPISGAEFVIGHDAQTTDPNFNGTYYAELNSSDQTGVCYASLNTLPVEFLSFTAEKLNEHDVNLAWITANELNNDFFLLEKMKDNGEFVQIAKVDGSGTTSIETKYAYTDQSAMGKTNYYRLKQVDFDGTSDYSDVVEVKFDLFNNDQFVVFPSPATDFTTLKATGTLDGTYTYSVTDFHGRTLIKGKISSAENGQVKIDLSDMAEGVYYIRTVSPRAKSYLNRVIKVTE